MHVGKKWQKKQEKLSEAIIETSNESMKKAAAEARQLAIDREHVIDNIPWTTVEADGSYMKRSYMHSSYDSTAGCMVIVEAHTKKVLQIVTKKKTCSKCDYAFSMGKILDGNHEGKCYRNHGRNQSSTSMESAGIAEAFLKSIEETGMMYKILITDEDSSNFGAVTEALPYVIHGVEVQNILCVNHLFRNLSTILKLLSKKKGFCAPEIRKFLKECGLTMVQTIQIALGVIQQKSCDWHEKVRMLNDDIGKIPYHVAGDHSLCIGNNFGCKGIAKDGEKNFLPDLIKLGLLEEFLESKGRLETHAESLLYGFTTNSVEAFNALIAKTIGHKAFNYAKKDGYKLRAKVAVLSWNEKATYDPICKTMGKQTPSVGRSIQEKRNEKNEKRTERGFHATF